MLSFRKSDRISLLIIAIIITSLQLIGILIRPQPIEDKLIFMPLKTDSTTNEINQIQNDHLKIKEPTTHPKNLEENYRANDKSKIMIETPETLFVNRMDSSEWANLGFHAFVCSNITRYLKAGGTFNDIEDLKKIYNIDQEILQALAGKFDFHHERKPKWIAPQKTLSKVNINMADTTELKSLRGIGSVFARRIIKYRNRLGGFRDTLQLVEVYGITDSIFVQNKKRIICSGHITTLDINKISEAELYSHPYFRGKLSQMVIEFRNQHGLYSQIEDLKRLYIMNDSIFEKIAPYISVSHNN